MDAFRETLLTASQPLPVDAFLLTGKGAAFSYGAHHHDYIELLYVLEGGILLETDSGRIQARAGDLVMFRAGTPHAVAGVEGRDSRILVVQFLPDLLEGTSGQDPARRHLHSFLFPAKFRSDLLHGMRERLPAWHDLAWELYGEICARQPGYELQVRSCLYRMIVLLYREGLLGEEDDLPNDTDMERLLPLIDWIGVHFREPVNLSAAAEQMNFSYAYMSRLFRRTTGRSFRAYVEHVRLCEAERWIRSGRHGITQAALEAGFGSASAFARVYRRVRGTAPGVLLRQQGIAPAPSGTPHRTP